MDGGEGWLEWMVEWGGVGVEGGGGRMGGGVRGWWVVE